MQGRFGAPGRISVRLLCSILAISGFLLAAAVVSSSVSAQSQTMVASWYGPGFENATTASGEPFDAYGYTAAHKTLPFGTKLIVTYNGASVVVVINDRGPFIPGRDIDLSQGAADAIGLTAAGEGVVGIEYADASVPVGPYSGAAPAAPEEVVANPAQPVSDEPSSDAIVTAQYDNGGGSAADGQYDNTDDSAADGQYGNDSAAGDQYDDSAADGQYDNDSAAGDQYDDSAADEQYSPEIAQNNIPASPAPVAIPEATTVEAPPVELAVPGSTVERRIELAIAAPPVGYTGPVAVEEVEVAPPAEASAEEIKTVYGPSSAPSLDSGLVTLPDTGGLPLVPVVAGAAVVLMISAAFGARAIIGGR